MCAICSEGGRVTAAAGKRPLASPTGEIPCANGLANRAPTTHEVMACNSILFTGSNGTYANGNTGSRPGL